MGADLILAYCPVPCYADLSVVQTFVQTEGKYEFTLSDEGKRVRAEVEARVKALGESERARLISDTYGDDDEPEDEQIDRFLGAFNDVFGRPFGRDTTDLVIGGRWYTFTGGMSWGDTPTDSYDSVVLLGNSGILESPFGEKCDCGHIEGNYPCEVGTAGEGCGS